jgi:NADH-quinone oxidoreductase subunit G
VCTLCPAQCNVTFTVRDERVLRVLARDHAEVDDGWLCDAGRFAYQPPPAREGVSPTEGVTATQEGTSPTQEGVTPIHERVTAPSARITQPLVRDGGELRPATWERALQEAAAGLRRAGSRSAALVGGRSTSEEGLLLARLLREGLRSERIDTLAGVAPAAQRRLAHPELQARVSDLEFAHTVLVLGAEPARDIPILDLRIRKGVRRNGVKLAIAGPEVSSLHARAQLNVRYAPGGDGAFARALAAALHGEDLTAAAHAAGAEAEHVRALANLLSTGAELRSGGASVSAPQDIVILYGEGVLADGGAEAVARIAAGLKLAAAPGAGLLGVPAAGTNGRGLAEAGVTPGYGPGYVPRESEQPAAGVHEIGELLCDGEISALYLLHADPLRSQLARERWRQALARATTVIAHAEHLSEGLREHATVVFPAESNAEKEGTIVHPDGRLQRLRAAIGRPGSVRAEWQVLCDLAARLGLDLGVLSGPMASQQLYDAVPFYAGVTLEEIGGRGLRWPEREAAAAYA